MDTPLYLFCAASGWLAFAYKLRDLRHDPTNRVLRAMVYAFCSFAVAITLAVPPIAATVDAGTGLPNLARIVSHAAVMSIAAHAELLLLFLALPAERAAPRARLRLWASTAAFGVLAALWLATLPMDPPVDLDIHDGANPTVAVYMTLYLAVFVAYCADIARLCWRFARVSPRSWLRLGLRVTATGAGVALVYCTSKAGYLAAYRFGYQPAGEPEINSVLVTISAMLMLVGLTLPTWGPRVDAASGWVARLVCWRRLDPLWRAVVAAQPHLVLDERAHHWRVALRDLDYALHRRITEIRDGRLALRPYIDERVGRVAGDLAAEAGLPPDRRTVVVEAAMLAAGTRAARSGTPAVRPDGSCPHSPVGGYLGEIRWLTRVARAFRRSPVVATSLARTARFEPDGQGTVAPVP
nr:MAB_1171c family putative transporter [Micromonospora sp. DSM 115978]